MQKDVIYIDTEDNITDIIAKVKESDGKIVVLVPPKRIGAIQSAVNLKLVHRAAESAKKHLVIVTNNPALSALAGSVGIPIAKNLQSKPEMPQMKSAEIEGEDIIDGNAIPVGEYVKLAGQPDSGDDTPEADAATVGAGNSVALAAGIGQNARAAKAARARAKIPNFDSFRKKLFIGIAAVVLLIPFLVWAVVFAPKANIVVKAKTSDAALNTKVIAGASLTTDLKAGTLKSEFKTTNKDVSVPFTATGSKNIGEKATGTVRIKTDAVTILLSGLTVPAGTVIANGGFNYQTTEAATFEKGDADALGGVVVGVAATEPGTKFNGASGSATTNAEGVSSVSFVTSTTGGTDKNVAVVQQSDIDAVSSDVQKSTDAEQAKKDLKNQFGANYIIIEDTFKSDIGSVKATPAAGGEAADGKGALAGKITYTIVAIPRTEAEKYLNAYFAQQVDGKQDQKVYDNGVGSVSFTAPVADKDNYVVTATANGKIGPKIDENKVKEYAKGKKSGEIKAYVEAINGVESADVTFSPFWVTSAPGDTNKIKVQFNLNG